MVQENIEYLFSLKYKSGEFLKASVRRTFIYGLTITAKSVLSVSQDLLFSDNTSYKYILSYKFSQDHLELLFAKIRGCNGHNNNPNALQFRYTIRKLLFRNSIKSSNNINCIQFDTDPLGSVFDLTWKKKRKETIVHEENSETDDENNNTDTSIILQNTPIILQKLQENMLYYISGYVVKKLKNINCYSCAEALLQNNTEHNYAHYAHFSPFLDYNDNNLVRPSISVFKVILETEKYIRFISNNLSQFQVKQLDIKVITHVKNLLALDPCIFKNLNCEDIDLLEIPHKIKLITALAQRYLKIRLYSYAKFYTQEILKPLRKRHRLIKQILFACE